MDFLEWPSNYVVRPQLQFVGCSGSLEAHLLTKAHDLVFRNIL